MDFKMFMHDESLIVHAYMRTGQDSLDIVMEICYF